MTAHPYIRAGVIGHPIAQSKSPLIHNHWIEKHGLSGEYTRIEILPENLQDRIKALVEDGYAGFNVTAPHKQAIFKLCDEVDVTAIKIGAVNTVAIQDGKIFGTNTDAFGFMENLQRSSFGCDVAHRSCVVLGAGGAARAIIYGLVQAGAKEIIIINRTRENAQDIAAMYPEICKTESWEDRSAALENAGLLVNTTLLGMVGKNALEMDLSALPFDAVVSDIVYAPLMTDLLNDASARGNQIVTGIGMLLHQARPAFEKWFGILPDVDEDLERKVLA